MNTYKDWDEFGAPPGLMSEGQLHICPHPLAEGLPSLQIQMRRLDMFVLSCLGGSSISIATGQTGACADLGWPLEPLRALANWRMWSKPSLIHFSEWHQHWLIHQDQWATLLGIVSESRISKLGVRIKTQLYPSLIFQSLANSEFLVSESMLRVDLMECKQFG